MLGQHSRGLQRLPVRHAAHMRNEHVGLLADVSVPAIGAHGVLGPALQRVHRIELWRALWHSQSSCICSRCAGAWDLAAIWLPDTPAKRLIQTSILPNTIHPPPASHQQPLLQRRLRKQRLHGLADDVLEPWRQCQPRAEETNQRLLHMRLQRRAGRPSILYLPGFHLRAGGQGVFWSRQSARRHMPRRSCPVHATRSTPGWHLAAAGANG